MKLLVAASALAVLMSLGAVTSASAFSFSPPNTKFHLTGTVTISGSEGTSRCTMKSTGSTGASPNKAIIKKALFGGLDPPCGLTATNLSWALAATSTRKGTISDFAFTPGGDGNFGPCGPGTIRVTVNKRGVWTLDGVLPGGCTISGSIPTSPPVTIVP